MRRSLACLPLLALLFTDACGTDSSGGGVGGETDTQARSSSDALTDAFERCSTGEAVDWSAYGTQAPPVSDVVNLADDGDTIIISTPFTEGESLGNLGYYVAVCVLEETDAPDSVGAKLEQANLASIKTQNSETYEDVTFEWYDYEVIDGTEFDATFESR